MMLFSGTSNLPLATKIAKILKQKLEKVEITRFIDNECRVYVKEEVKNQHVYVIQSLSSIADQRLVELCLLGQAIKNLGAKKITAVIPWMGYSKQDKAFRKGEAISAQLVAKFIESAGFDEVITIELHSENVVPYWKIPVKELHTQSILAKEIVKKNLEVVISPDRGGQSRSDKFAKLINLPVIHLAKHRDLESGNVEILSASAQVVGKTAIIYDDIINTGATAIKTAQFLKKQKAAKIIFLATHAVFAGDASEKLDSSSIDEIIVTDTIKIPARKLFKKLRVVSCASLIADSIENH